MYRNIWIYLSLFLSFVCTIQAAGAERPSILWISLEDITPMMGCYGDTYARTPVFDKLAEKGIINITNNVILKKRLDRLALEDFHDAAEAPVPPYHRDVPEFRKGWAQYYDSVAQESPLIPNEAPTPSTKTA